VEAFEGFVPEAAVDEVVPLGDEVIDGATGGHAAEEVPVWQKGMPQSMQRAPLLAQLGFVDGMELVPIADALERGAVEWQFAEIFEESGGFTHDAVKVRSLGGGVNRRRCGRRRVYCPRRRP
jgi:hypothetical protein